RRHHVTLFPRAAQSVQLDCDSCRRAHERSVAHLTVEGAIRNLFSTSRTAHNRLPMSSLPSEVLWEIRVLEPQGITVPKMPAEQRAAGESARRTLVDEAFR